MANYKQLFMQYMDREHVKYTDLGENRVKVVYSGDNLKSIPIIVCFDKDGDPLVTFYCWEIANFKGDKTDAGIKVCNDMNNAYRWVKFYLDKDGDIVAQIDAYVDEQSCGNICLSLVRRTVNITDEAYPKFMQANWA